MTLNEKLRFLRVKQGLTQKQVSEYLHITRSSYCNYETHKRLPSYPLIVLLADFYHVSVDYLVRDDYNEHPTIYTKETDQQLLLMKDKTAVKNQP